MTNDNLVFGYSAAKPVFNFVSILNVKGKPQNLTTTVTTPVTRVMLMMMMMTMLMALLLPTQITMIMKMKMRCVIH